MPENTQISHLKILHVLTLNGENGEYGGPVRVARELCNEISRRGHNVEIISGAIVGSAPISNQTTIQTFEYVRPLSKRFRVSSYWSWKLAIKLNKKISVSNVVHVHFARDLIPFCAVLLCIFRKKPFVSQTHGMVIFDGRIATKILDTFFTKWVLNHSKTVFALTEAEKEELLKLGISAPIQIMGNGIALPNEFSGRGKNEIQKIIFCSRLHSRKGLSQFIELARNNQKANYVFEIYGPDAGELQNVLRLIEEENLAMYLSYKGSLKSSDVVKVLADSDLLILPSKDEPFPMIVLESLSVGTPVIVMPTCGIANALMNLDRDFVTETTEFQSLANSFEKLIKRDFGTLERNKIREFVNREFSISKLVDLLELKYLDLTSK